jgi:hypothetical protein
MSACFADVTFATVTWDIVYTLLRLLDISDWSSFHQCPMEGMFSFENGPDIEMVSNVSEFLRDTLDILEDHATVLYLKKDGCFSMASLWSQ